MSSQTYETLCCVTVRQNYRDYSVHKRCSNGGQAYWVGLIDGKEATSVYNLYLEAISALLPEWGARELRNSLEDAVVKALRLPTDADS